MLGHFHHLRSVKIHQFFVLKVAKTVLLPVSEVKLWLNHLLEVHKNRQWGAAKAAETRKAKRASAKDTVQLQPSDNQESEKEIVYCGACNGPYEEETEDVEDWICCDGCETWFH